MRSKNEPLKEELSTGKSQLKKDSVPLRGLWMFVTFLTKSSVCPNNSDVEGKDSKKRVAVLSFCYTTNRERIGMTPSLPHSLFTTLLFIYINNIYVPFFNYVMHNSFVSLK